MHNDAITGRRPDLWAGALLFTLFAARLWFIASGQLDLVQDEAQYWDWTRRLQLSYYSKGPLIAWLIAFWTGIFGDTELGVRIGALVNSTIASGALYWWVSRVFGRPRAALTVLVVAATMPLFLGSGLIMNTDNPLMLCWIAGLICLDAAGRGRGGRWPYVVLALAMGLGILAKYMMLAFAATAVLYGLALGKGRPARFWPRLWIAMLAGAAAGMAPILIWNAQTDWVGFRHVSHLTGLSGSGSRTILRLDRVPDFVGSQLLLAAPWWLAFMVVAGWRGARAFFGLSKGDAYGLSRDRLALLLAGFWPIFGGLALWSLHAKILGNWPAMSYVTGVILAALAFDRYRERVHSRAARVLWPALGALVALVLLLQGFLPLPAAYDPALRLKGWEDLGREVAELRDSRFGDPERVFIFSDSYDMTAALAFYVPGRPRTYCVDSGRRLSQYDYWPGPEDKKGWDAIYVRKDWKDNPAGAVPPLFDRIERIEYQSHHLGRPARRFTIFLCYGYNGEWPRTSRGDY